MKFNKKAFLDIIIDNLVSLIIPLIIIIICYYFVNKLKSEIVYKFLLFVVIFIILISCYILLYQYVRQLKQFNNFFNKIKINKLYLLLFLFNKNIFSGFHLIRFPQISIIGHLGKPFGQSLIIIKLKECIYEKHKILINSRENKKIILENINNKLNIKIFKSQNIENTFFLKVVTLFQVNYIELRKRKIIISVNEKKSNDEDMNRLILKLEELGIFLNNYGVI